MTSKREQSRAIGLEAKVKELEAKLAEAEETLRAIQAGEVDAVVVRGPRGEQVFTLRGAEYAYRALVEAMNEGAATISADGIILYSNGRIAPMLGIPQERVIGHPVTSLIDGTDQQTFASMFARALSGEPCTSEIALCWQDGSTTPVYASLSRLQVNDEPAVCMVVTDLREHKKRDELIAVGDLARSILQHAGEAIAVCDLEGRIILGNEALQRLCGGDPLYRSFDEIVPLEIPVEGSSGQRTQRFSVKAALSSDNIRAEEVVYRRREDRRKDSRVSHFLLTAGPLRSGDQVLGCVLTLTDVTHRKLAENALLRTEKLAATGQLAASIAHEINNPLSAVFNLLYLIESAPSLELVQEYARSAIGEISRVSHITKQTLAFYRDSVGPEKVRISEILDEILALFRKDFEARKATFLKHYEIAGEVHAYPGEMRQVFSNLLRNAVDAVEVGGHIRLHVRRAHRGDSEGVAVFIADDGVGIPTESRSRIFEPFFTTKGTKGTGLGLWVAKGLVQKHGGTIAVRSSVAPTRHGSCFHVFIPANATVNHLWPKVG